MADSMASIRKRGKSWTAQVVRQVDGKRLMKAATFTTKAEASAWAARTETEIADGKLGKTPDKTFGQLLERYRAEVTPTKRGALWESKRIAVVLRDDIAMVSLRELAPGHFAAWRDRRMRSVKPASVLRDWTVLSAACMTAWKEWRWLNCNPMTDVKRPSQPEARDRRISQAEIYRLLLAFGDDYNTRMGRVGVIMLFAIETAMRAGEIVGLKWPDVNLEKQVLKIRAGKTAAAARNVPLSTEAVRLLKLLPVNDDSVFGMTSSSLDALFRRGKSRALVMDLHFHDTRHEAITRLANKLDVLALARMVGHRDLKMLQVYYNETAEELAKRLS